MAEDERVADEAPGVEPAEPAASSFLEILELSLTAAAKSLDELHKDVSTAFEQSRTSLGASLDTLAGPATGGGVHFNAPVSSDGQVRAVFFSYELLAQRLPWTALNETAAILEKATGWALPQIIARTTLDQASSPLATFLMIQSQLRRVIETALQQIQAWQSGTGSVDVTLLGHTARLLALQSQIDASLAKLFGFLFLKTAAYTAQEIKTAAYDAVTGPLLDSNIARIITRQDQGLVVSRPDQPATERSQPVYAKDGDEDDEDIFLDAYEEEHAADVVELHPRPQLSANESAALPKVEEVKIEVEMEPSQKIEIERVSSDVEMKDDDTPESAPLQPPQPPPMDFSAILSSLAGSAPSSTGPAITGGVPNQSRSNGIDELPPVVKARYTRWTSDPRKFSSQVIMGARFQRAPSNAYRQGSVFGSGSPSPPPAPESLFKLQWSAAASRANVRDLFLQVPGDLSSAFVSTVVSEIAEKALKHPDFLACEDRFANLKKLKNLMEGRK